MDYSDALQRIRRHANAPEGESFSLALSYADRQTVIPNLRPMFDDIMLCLEVVNRELNSQHPSETIEGKADLLPRSLVADISWVLFEGHECYWRWAERGQFTPEFRSELAAMLIQIGIAWNAVLAGDIDDIRENVATEYLARDYEV